jgi:hypothetical protein
MDDPDTEADIDPRPLAFVAPSVIATVPVNEVAVWAMRHVMVPGPDESAAEPVHVPVRSGAEGEGEGGAGV